MIAFGVSVTEPEVYERCAEPGIRLVAEPDTEVMAHGSTGSVFRSYNMLMDQARKLEGLEALVLIHQDAEIIDPDFLTVPERSQLILGAMRGPAGSGFAGNVGRYTFDRSSNGLSRMVGTAK